MDNKIISVINKKGGAEEIINLIKITYLKKING